MATAVSFVITDEELAHAARQMSEIQAERLRRRGVFEAATPQFDEPRLRAYFNTDLASLPEVEWLVEDLIEAGGLTILGGHPGAGKTFVAMDVAMSLAAGHTQWNGKRLPGEPITVVYLLAEGWGGVKVRVEAWEIANDMVGEKIPVLWTQSSINLVKGGAPDIESLERLIEEFKPGLIVFDTFARMTGGMDENQAGEMGALIAKMTEWQQTYETAILVLHHSTKEGTSFFRGSGALPGAADVAVGIEATSTHRIYQLTWRKKDTKLKNAEAPEDLLLKMEPYGDSVVLQPIAYDPVVRTLGTNESLWREKMDDPDFAELTQTRQAEIIGVDRSRITEYKRNLAKEGIGEEPPTL